MRRLKVDREMSGKRKKKQWNEGRESLITALSSA